MIVLKQNAGFGVHGNVNVRPPIVVEIIRHGSYRIPWTGFKNPCLLRYVRKRSVAIVVVENVGIGGKTARAAHDGDALPLAVMRRVRGWNLLRIQLDVVADEKVEKAIAVVIEEGTARAPANIFL